MSWSIHREYLESCDCTVLCPCITPSLRARRRRPIGDAGLNGNYRACAWAA